MYSKMMRWVALHRGLRIVERPSFHAERDRWMRERDAIYDEIMVRGWTPRQQAFVPQYSSDAIDASALMMPLVFFVSPVDPRMLKTIDAIMPSPREGGLVFERMLGFANHLGLYAEQTSVNFEKSDRIEIRHPLPAQH